MAGTLIHTDHVAARAGWTAVAIALLGLGIQAWFQGSAFPGATILQMAMVGAALLGAYLCWTLGSGPSRLVQVILMTGAATALGLATAQQILNAPFYGTDSVAFGQYSAHLVLRGLNPYTASMAPSIGAFHVPVVFTTHFLDGRSMVNSSYPAGSFLFYLPAMALGWSSQVAVVIDVLFWIAGMFVLWIVLPETVRWMAGLLLASSIYASFVIGGVTDSLYIPFLVVAVWRWDRFGDVGEAGAARWIGPLALGMAMSVKQTPWFALLFLVLGIAIEAHRRGQRWFPLAARYTGLCVGVFTLINGPWIVLDPVAWFKGASAPITASFVPLGQGLINLTLIERVGGGDLSYYTYAAAAALVLALLLLTLYYERFKQAWMFLLIGTFFFTPRSLGNYFLMLMPAALVAALTVRPVSAAPSTQSRTARRGLNRHLRAVPAGCTAALVVVSLALAAIAKPPLSVRILSLHSNGEEELVTTAVLLVHNNTDSAVRPFFTVNTSGYITNFWRQAGIANSSVTTVIPPRTTKTVTIVAPDVPSMPAISQPFQVYAYTTGPRQSVSASGVELPTMRTVYLTPSTVDSPVRLGDQIDLTAQVDDRLGRAVHQSGMRIELGQVVYAQHGLLGGDASINGNLEGASPISVTTDSSGKARFVIKGVQVGADPTYFQAWIAPAGETPPSGYSQIVAVRFTQTTNP